MAETLYDKLGGEKGISSIARDIITNHLKNPIIKVRFQDTDTDKLHRLVVEFFSMGTGGPQKYTGKDMREAHKAMNINAEEFLTVIDDVMAALDSNGIGPETKDAVLGILYSLKGDVMRV